MKRLAALAAVAAVMFAAGAAFAHQAPSVESNNRYMKVTFLPDRVHVTHTLLYGERPGAAARRAMDTDGDGQISEAEKAAFGAGARDAYAPAVMLDGARVAGWRVADVGLGTPDVRGGTFAVDLVLDAAYADPRADEHTVVVDDAAAVPLAGEVELRIGESPGVRVLESHLASESAGVELTFVFTGNAASARERAVAARFTVAEELRPRPRGKVVVVVAVVAAVLAAAGGAVVLWRRRSRS